MQATPVVRLRKRFYARPNAGQRQTRPPVGLVLGAGAVVLAMLLPLAYLVVRSTDATPAAWAQFLSLRTLIIVANSAALAVATAASSVVIAVPLAWLTTRTDLPGRRLWGVAVVMPLVIPSYVGAFVVLALLGPKGMVQGWLAPLGVERLPEIYGFVGAWLTLTLFSYPYVLLTVRAAWRRLDASLAEAARSLGHTPWSVFWRVTLPSLRPAMAAGGLLVALYALSDFGAVSLMRYNAFTQAIYAQYRSSFDRSLAALLATMLVLATLVLLWLERHAQGRSRAYRVNAGTIRPLPRARLGRWRWPALIALVAFLSLALGAPLAVMVAWLVRGLMAGTQLQPLGQAALNTVYAAGLAMVVTTLAALPIAILATRHDRPLARLLERASHLGNGLPGIAIALALVFFGANYVPFLYQTVALMIFAYVVRFLPQAVGAGRTSLGQINPRLEEAARSLGLSPWRTWLRVTLPLARPGLLAGATLVFLTAVKELPVTLMLSPTGFKTLATEIWSATAEAFFARAAAPALLLVAVSSLSVLVILAQDRDHA